MKPNSIIILIVISTALLSGLYLVRQRTQITIHVDVVELTLVRGKKRQTYLCK